MKKIGILTIVDCDNYGNRLQSYALQRKINSFSGIEAFQILNFPYLNEDKHYYFRLIKYLFNLKKYSNNKKRKKNFKKFENYITYSSNIYTAKTKKLNFDYVVVGSDQVWNPNFGRLRKVDLLTIIPSYKRLTYAVSFGVTNLEYSKLDKNLILKELLKFQKISVREDAGKKIVEELTGRNDVEVLIDPTMLLTADEWDEVSKKPTILKNDKYILNYFLGNLSDERRNEINRVAKENNCEVINILDKESPFYECGPSEFLYLEKNAFLICTDSFHSSVFGILYNTPFLVFEREDNNASMNSRLDTLLFKFKLEDRRYKGKITKKDLKCDYKEAYNILDKERIKSMNFLRKALDIKDSDKNE